MRILIVGIGKLGEYLAKQLCKEEYTEVTLVDLKFEGKESLIDNEDVNYIEGNGLDSNILIKAGIQETDLLISVMKRDSENIMCSLIGKKLGARHTIARIRTPEYTNSVNLLKDTLSLSMIINPEKLTAIQIAQSLSIPSALDATTFLNGRMNVISLKIKENNRLIGTTIKELCQKLRDKVIVCAIERDEKVIIPNGDSEILLGDKIHITGKRKDINSFLKYTKLISEKTKKVMIVGGSDISMYLTGILTDMGMSVKIIDNDLKKCEELSEKLPKAMVIHGDMSKQNLLYEEGIEDHDAFVALTGLDEQNIVYSMFASSISVPKVITKINHIDLDYVVKKANIDTVVASHKIAANQVVKYVRARVHSGGSSCEAIYKFENIFEIMEYKVKSDFKGLDKKLKELNLKDNFLIGAIQRGKNIIYPSGEDVIKLNDTIVVIAKEGTLKELNDMVIK